MGKSSAKLLKNGPAKPASAADAQLILQLYDLRRDDEMRHARHFVSAEFWPETAEDVLRVIRAYPSQENAYLRQVTTYWEMAASFVVRGALNADLFFDNSGEMYCVFAKFEPYLAQLRQKLPYFLVTVEKVINQTAQGRERLQRLRNRLARREQKLGAKRAVIAATSAGYQ